MHDKKMLSEISFLKYWIFCKLQRYKFKIKTSNWTYNIFEKKKLKKVKIIKFKKFKKVCCVNLMTFKIFIYEFLSIF